MTLRKRGHPFWVAHFERKPRPFASASLSKSCRGVRILPMFFPGSNREASVRVGPTGVLICPNREHRAHTRQRKDRFLGISPCHAPPHRKRNHFSTGPEQRYSQRKGATLPPIDVEPGVRRGPGLDHVLFKGTGSLSPFPCEKGGRANGL